MSEKKMKRLRKEMKRVSDFDIKAPADYRVSKETKKIVYLKINEGGMPQMKAVPVTMKCVVNATKLPYRRLKKEFKSRTKR